MRRTLVMILPLAIASAIAVVAASATQAAPARADVRAPEVIAPARTAATAVDVEVVDRGSGVAGPATIRLAGLKLGSNVRFVDVIDRAGNDARARVVVIRTISFSFPELNRGSRSKLGFSATQHDLDRAFRFLHPFDPWYSSTIRREPVVRELQRRLQQLGHYSRRDPHTGLMDIPTIKAVKRFQRANDIPSIATVGPRTRLALDVAVA